MATQPKLTPMMQQYHATRRELPTNTLLLFRLGDFYEMFFEDAKTAAAVLNVALTKRGSTPMCGVPYHAARGYIEKLVAAGHKVAICDQVGEVEQGKLVRRELTHILSAGSLDDFGLDAKKSNFLAAISVTKKIFGLAYADLSTGEFFLTETASKNDLLDELARIAAVEAVVPEESESAFAELPGLVCIEGYHFEKATAAPQLCEHFGVQNLDGFGCAELGPAVGAAGALLHYLSKSLRRDVSHFRTLRPYSRDAFLVLDAVTQTHLELVNSVTTKSNTLLAAMDNTRTPMGSRLLRNWLLHPLCSVDAVLARQWAVKLLLGDVLVLDELREALGEIRDLERCASRLSLGSGTPRDLRALLISLQQIPALRQRLADILKTPPDEKNAPNSLGQLYEELRELPELCHLIGESIVDEPPVVLRDGGVIRDGYDVRLDELRSASREGKEWIAALQEREIERTGIRSLKVRYTSVFGYFIEVTKSNLGSVPEDYQRKQTTTNAERFFTPELKEMESKILGADDKAKALEIEIFQTVRREVLNFLSEIQSTARAVAGLDVLTSFASSARLYNYTCPEILDATSGILRIEAGRHPVLDIQVEAERFVPNDTALEPEKARLAIITGPNMAGKSTYIRQVALLVIMAQMGSFIPADSARIGIVDRIFTRVGASDDLARGRSTFMVEMSETANILNNATAESLVILDEIGRGTSTFDGLSLAWSVAEHLHDEVKCRALFATHYHELTDLERTRTAVLNLNVSVREWKDEIVFLRKIVPGRADQSYGIHVARLAGLPVSVLSRAKEILANLEKSELTADGKPAIAAGARRRSAAILLADHPDLFEDR
ncbi:MAG: DNA mismatch repair protein MutS [Chthoniobacterales bacterium]